RVSWSLLTLGALLCAAGLLIPRSTRSLPRALPTLDPPTSPERAPFRTPRASATPDAAPLFPQPPSTSAAPPALRAPALLAPANRDAWFDSYTNLLGDFAAMAAMTGASRFVIGSELSSLDGDLPRWRTLIERMRAVFPGTLLYSANWDHYRDAAVLDLVDEAG